MKKSTLLIALFIIFSITHCIAYVYGPESMVYYPRWNSYLVANLGIYDEVNKGLDPGHISLMFYNQVFGGFESGTIKVQDFDNPKGLFLEGDLIYFLNRSELWCVRLLDYKVMFRKYINNNKSVPTLTDMYKLNDIIYITDNYNNTVFKFDMTKDTVIDLKFSTKITAPRCITYDDVTGKLIFVTQEKNSRIFSIDPSNDSLELIKTTEIENMYGITKDKSRNYYITSWGDGNNFSSKVYKFTEGLLGNSSVFKDSLTKATSIYYNSILDEIGVPELRIAKWSNTNAMYDDKDVVFITFSSKPKPGTPSLIYPLNNQINVSIPPEIQWSKIYNSDYYAIEISDSANFPKKLTFVNYSHINFFNRSTLMRENRKYYIRIKAVNHSESSDWSEVSSFTTGLKSLAPPVSDTINKDYAPVSVLPVFSWHSNGADYYNLQIYEEKYAIDKKGDKSQVIPDVLNPTFSFDNITDTVYTMTTKLNEGTDYYWRVRGVKDTKYSQWSQLLLFRTEGINGIAFDDTDKRLTVFSNHNENFSTVNFTLGYESVVNVILINPISMERIALYNGIIHASEFSFLFSYQDIPSGVYFIVVMTERETLNRKILVVK